MRWPGSAAASSTSTRASGPRLEFSGVFGRNLEYYTGFVFQIEVDRPARRLARHCRRRALRRHAHRHRLARGGAGVGCAIHTERLLAAAQGSLA
jgi:histidyl-tRNA synthetase